MKFKKLEDCQALMPFLDKAGEIHKKYILTYEIIFQTLIFLDGGSGRALGEFDSLFGLWGVFTVAMYPRLVFLN